MWDLIKLLFLVLCFFTEAIRCDGPENDDHDNLDKHDDHEDDDSEEKDDNNLERQRNGKILIVVIPVVGAFVLLMLVISGICIFKKYNRKNMITDNYQEKRTTEKYMHAFPIIASDDPPPYSPKVLEGVMKSAPEELTGYGTGWFAPTIVSMPPPYTKVVSQAFQPDSTAAPGY